MQTFFGIVKIVLAAFMLLIAAISILPALFDTSSELTTILRYLLGLVMMCFYAYYLLYSGRTEYKRKPISKRYIIWGGIIYGFGCCLYFFVFSPFIMSSFIASSLVGIISFEDLIRITKKSEAPDETTQTPQV